MSALLPALAWALLDFVWQGLLVGWGAALLLATMRTARPQARYALACAALLLCAALPLSGVVQRLADVQTLNSTFLPLAGAGPAQDIGVLQSSEPSTLIAGWERALRERLPLVVLLWSCGAALLALRDAWTGVGAPPDQQRPVPHRSGMAGTARPDGRRLRHVAPGGARAGRPYQQPGDRRVVAPGGAGARLAGVGHAAAPARGAAGT